MIAAMNLQDLRAFVAVAETGSISRAALRLHLTQPATTRRVQNFEAAMGSVALFDRTSKPLIVTPAGRQVLERCREVLRAIAELESSAWINGEPHGELRMGVGMGAEALLDPALEKLRRRFPRVVLRITADWTAMLIEALRTGALDVALAFVTTDHRLPPKVVMNPAGTETIKVVAARDAKLPRKRGGRLRLRDLGDYRWILNPDGCAYRVAVQRAHDVAGIPLQLAADVIGRDMQLSMVARGMGLGLASERAVRTSPYRRALRFVPLEDFQLTATVAVLHAGSLGSLDPVADLLQSQLTRQLAR